LTILSLITRSFRWILILDCIGYRLRFTNSLKLYLTGIYYASISPGRIGEFIRGYRISRNLSIKNGLASVIYDRLYDIITPLSIATAYMLIKQLYSHIIFLLAFATIFILILWTLFIHILQKLRKFKYFKDIRHIKIFAGHQLMQAILSLTTWILYGVIGYFLLIGLGNPINFEYVLFSVCIVTLFAMIPITIGGWGVREYGYIMLFSPFLNPDKSIIFSITFVFITTYFLAFLGLIIEFLFRDSK